MSELLPVYVIYSSQDFRLEEAVHRLKEKVSKDSSLDYFEFQAPAPAEEVINTARTLSLSLSKKIINYKSIDLLDKNETNLLLDYVKKPNDFTILILSAVLPDYKSEKAFLSANPVALYASKQKYLFSYKVPKKANIVDWIIQKVKDQGSSIEAEAARYLYELAGDDLRTIDNEISKLILFCNGRTIAIDDARKSVVAERETNIFILVDAIGMKETGTALTALNKLLVDNEPPLKVLSMIQRQFRLLIQAKAMNENGMSLKQTASELKVQTFVAEKIINQSRNFTDKSLKEAFDAMVHADQRLKTGARPQLTLEKTIVFSTSA